MKDYGIFNLYKKDESNILYAKNTDNVDWYDIAHDKNHSKGCWLILSSDNKVIGGDTEPDKIWPDTFRIIFLEGETDYSIYQGKILEENNFVDQKEIGIVPTIISKSSLLLVLLENKPQVLESQIFEKINEIEDFIQKEKLRILLNSVSLKRDSDLVKFIQNTFKISKTKMDKIFLAASKL